MLYSIYCLPLFFADREEVSVIKLDMLTETQKLEKFNKTDGRAYIVYNKEPIQATTECE